MDAIVGRPGIDHGCQNGDGVADQIYEVGLWKYVAEFGQDHVVARRLVQKELFAGFFKCAAVEVAQHEAYGLPIGLFALGQVREEILDADEREAGAVIGGDAGLAEAEQGLEGQPGFRERVDGRSGRREPSATEWNRSAVGRSQK